MSTLKDPRGGLTAAGRRWYREKFGMRLKPGVKKAARDMTLEEMRRKGSWAVRFYGRFGPLPPLVDAKGRPTRLALTAAAWGEKVPKTEAQARAIARKGRKLLAEYKRRKAIEGH
ncbi:MAG TPA: DUF6321 domain-containing protein [Phycisphaerales bacterium]|nr:DUF6321 domain-containing protein [Phycisphaerales bacterium]